MDGKLPILKIDTLGRIEITYGETALFQEKSAVSQTIRLLLLLVYSGEEGISRKTLLETMFEQEESSDAANRLRVCTHRLKKMLSDAGLPEYDYIVSQKGYYRWESPMEVQIDAKEFEKLYNAAESLPDGKEKMEMLREACALYKGEFLPKLSWEEWVIVENIRYKEFYTQAANQLCQYYMEQREYEEALKIADASSHIYPFDEWQAVKMDCYIAMNRYKDAMREYEETAKMLMEELGTHPSERMMKQFESMSQHISNRPQIIEEIQSVLKEEEREKGAFFCVFPSFRDGYRMVRRGMERNGQSVFLLVCTLTDGKGRPMEGGKKRDILSDDLYHAIQSSLRRCDSFTKYNSGQYLVMLMGTNKENCSIVIDRVKRNFSKEHKTWSRYLDCSISSLYDLNGEEEWERVNTDEWKTR